MNRFVAWFYNCSSCRSYFGTQKEINGVRYCLTENEPDRTLDGGIDTANEQYWETSVDQENNMVKKKMKVGISTIYYWFHNGHLGLTKADMLYPRKGKSVKKQASPNFKPAGKSMKNVLTLFIFAWKTVIMKLIRFY